MRIGSIIILFCWMSSATLLSQSYAEEEVVIELDGKGTLGGILTVPKMSKKMPAVLIIQGSGPTDKDGNSPLLAGKNNSLKLLSEALANAGIASLRYDKRGMGLSASMVVAEADLTFDDFVRDAELFLDYLVKDKRFKKIGVAGHSQGSLIGMLISQRKKVKAFASIAGPSLSIDETLLTQIKDNPYNPPALIKEAEQITASLRKGETYTDISPFLKSIYRTSIQPFMISWMKYDPTEEISKLKMPVLIVQGSTDLQVQVEDGQRLHISNENASLAIIKGMNHVLKDASGNRQENTAAYGNPDLPLNETFKKEITAFFLKNLK